MLIFVLGIVIFLGAHSFATFREERSRLIGNYGLEKYKAAFSIAAGLGLALIIWGFSRYRAEGLIQLWTPPTWARHLAMMLMWFAFVAMACVNPAPSKIRGWLRHPMLVGVKTWALAHLLANGDLGGLILFGSFLAWAVYDRIAVKKRGDWGAPRVASFTRADAISLGVGTLAFVAMLFLHPTLIGVPILRP